ncbi:uncharacterized protein LOC123315706 [Coccinella septempunctata]|uniref:uncharacterized protein LOC123315706 n=1 Tax=Coccinella septempunctata TaxID=41139 RepID=UPI001D07DCC3|nr:uncharacterized protein LOC123315706 [Coccinella septempunctata]
MSSIMMKKMDRVMSRQFLLLCFLLALFEQTLALKCYKCSFFSKPTYEDCVTPDAKTAVEECEEGEVCTAVGYNHVRNDTYTEYSNIRRCGKSNLCLGAFYAYGEDNLRNCHVCPTDLCNVGPLLPGATGSGSLIQGSAGNNSVVDGDEPKAEGEASADTKGNVGASGGVQG